MSGAEPLCGHQRAVKPPHDPGAQRKRRPAESASPALEADAIGRAKGAQRSRRGEEGGYGRDSGYGSPSAATDIKVPENWTLRRYDFLIQFCWQPTPRGTRLENMAKKASGNEEVPSTAAVPDDTASDSS